VTQIEFDAAMLEQLEAVYRTRDVLRRRRLVREALAPAPGERLLDVGCGPGFYIAELLDEIGPEGSAVGVDSSPPMLAAAAQRTAGRHNVSFYEGEATALPVEDASFDAALSVQVLEYVADVTGALREIARALRVGGRVVIWDVDWTTVSIHSSEPARTERVLRAWDRHLTHPALPRTLAAELRSAGFENVRANGHSFVTTEFVPDAYGGSIVPLIAQYVADSDDVTESDAEAWEADLRALSERGEFFFACLQFCFAATRAA
jgi:ubiquinone/menaquinone biosynthesis C-methylase UbiE